MELAVARPEFDIAPDYRKLAFSALRAGAGLAVSHVLQALPQFIGSLRVSGLGKSLRVAIQ